jgi:Flp pilus assembly protein TadG
MNGVDVVIDAKGNAMLAMLVKIQRFARRDVGGNFGIIFSLVFAVLAAAVGVGVDFARAISDKSSVQNAIDAALLGAMTSKHDRESQEAYAIELLHVNLLSAGVTISDIDIHHKDDSTISGTINGTTQTTLMSFLGKTQMDFVVNSEVVRGPQAGNPLCIMAMHPTRKHTLELKGSVSIYGPKCHIYGNSSHFDDVVDPHTPNNYITGASVTAVGYGHHYIQNVTPPLEGSTAVIADPYLNRTLPAIGSCNHTSRSVKSSKVTLDPGVYCGGLAIGGGAEVTLNPGIYTILGDALDIQNSTLTGSGVTIFFADRHAELKVVNSEVRLVAPTSGDWRSFVVVSKREENEWKFVGSTLDLYGIIYAPNSAVEWENSGTPNITAQWAAWITDGFSWTGNGTINFPYDTENATVPHPSSLNVIPRPSLSEVVHLVR